MVRTKVVRIIDPTRVVLAAGEIDGVREGMEFVIYELSDTVHDPETGEDLGRIELVKARVVASHVQERMTTARPKSQERKRIVNDYYPFAPRTATENVQPELKTEGVVAVLPDPVVRVGDLARSVS